MKPTIRSSRPKNGISLNPNTPGLSAAKTKMKKVAFPTAPNMPTPKPAPNNTTSPTQTTVTRPRMDNMYGHMRSRVANQNGGSTVPDALRPKAEALLAKLNTSLAKRNWRNMKNNMPASKPYNGPFIKF